MNKHVLIFGTFDGLHPGHLNVIQQAKSLGTELTVVIALDDTVVEVKGRRPSHNQEQRKAMLEKVEDVDHVYLGYNIDKYRIIEEVKPDIIALGYDQRHYTEKLDEELKRRNLNVEIVRLEAFHPDKYKTSLLRKKGKEKNALQEALNNSSYSGKIISTFSSSFGMEYQVGLAVLESGKEVIIKTKSTYRGELTNQTREQEFTNLKLLESLKSDLIPKALYYENGTLIMSRILGSPLDQNEMPDHVYEELGFHIKKINSIPLSNIQGLKTLSFKDYLQERKDHLYNNRLALDMIDRGSYDSITSKLDTLATEYEKKMMIWNDANPDNILFKQNKLSGLIDFEDMIIGPLILQLNAIKWIPDNKWDLFFKGYGTKNPLMEVSTKTNLLILKVYSALNAIGLATKEGDKAWKNKAKDNLDSLLATLAIK